MNATTATIENFASSTPSHDVYAYLLALKPKKMIAMVLGIDAGYRSLLIEKTGSAADHNDTQRTYAKTIALMTAANEGFCRLTEAGSKRVANYGAAIATQYRKLQAKN